jgi:hypothetical protein
MSSFFNRHYYNGHIKDRGMYRTRSMMEMETEHLSLKTWGMPHLDYAYVEVKFKSVNLWPSLIN